MRSANRLKLNTTNMKTNIKGCSTPILQTIEFKGKYLPNSFAIHQQPKYKALKSHCGSGGTSVLLASLDSCIVLTPNASQVKDKEEKGIHNLPDNVKVLFIYKDSKDRFKDVTYYQNKGFVVNVYTTYAQLNTNENNVLQFKDSHRLICDENHSLTANEYMNLLKATTKAIKGFKRVMLTTATENAIPIFNELPVIYYKGIDKPIIPIEFREFENLNKIKSFVQNVSEATNKHVIIVSNNIKVHRDFFADCDHFVGDTLEKKIAPFHENTDFISFDYSKKIHIISSTAWEGVDFNEDAICIIIGEYSHNKFKRPYGLTAINVFQSAMRRRGNIEQTMFLYTASKNYFNKLEEARIEDNFTAEIKEGIKQLFEFKKSDAFERVNVDSVILTDAKDYTKHPHEIFKNLSKYEHTENIIQNIFEHININRIVQVNRDNETMRDGRQFGLNIKETLFYLSHGITNRCNGFDAFYNMNFDSCRKDKQHNLVFEQVFKAISKAYYTHGFLADILKSECFYEGDIRLNGFGRVIYTYIIDSVINSKSATSRAYADNITMFYNNNVKMSEQGIQYAENQIHIEEHKRALKQKEIYLNYIVFYSLKRGSNLLKMVTAEAKEYINSNLYKLKQKKHDKPITEKQLIANHKMYVIENLLAYHNKTNIIALRRGNREFSLLTSHARPLRKLTPFIVSEMDFKSLYPTIAGNMCSKNMKEKVENGTIYNSNELTRDEMKVLVNRAFNLHEKNMRLHNRIDELIRAGMLEAEAYNFATIFAKKGSFYDHATKIEEELTKELMDRLKVLHTPKYRLHDAIVVFGNYNLEPFAEPITIASGTYYISAKGIKLKQVA